MSDKLPEEDALQWQKFESPIFVTRPHMPDREKLFQYLNSAYESKRLTNNGPLVQELTRRLTQFLGVSNLLVVSNATTGLMLALKLLGAKGEVLTTPFTFPATSSAICWQGCVPRYTDIDASTFNLNTTGLPGHAEGLSALLATHVFGQPCDVGAIQNWSNEHQVPVIYDAAHCFGVKLRGQSVLNYGDISVLSFHATKLFQTLEGGALVIPDDELFRRATRMINFGFDDDKGIAEIGINGKMNEFEAAMGLALLDDIGALQTRLKRVCRNYEANLTLNLQRQASNEAVEETYSYYPVLCADVAQVLKVAIELRNEGIFPRRYFYPSLDTLEIYGGSNNCPVSQDVASRILCLPMYADLKQGEVERICSIVNRVVDG